MSMFTSARAHCCGPSNLATATWTIAHKSVSQSVRQAGKQAGSQAVKQSSSKSASQSVSQRVGVMVRVRSEDGAHSPRGTRRWRRTTRGACARASSLATHPAAIASACRASTHDLLVSSMPHAAARATAAVALAKRGGGEREAVESSRGERGGGRSSRAHMRLMVGIGAWQLLQLPAGTATRNSAQRDRGTEHRLR
jgi:hypothetical protein